MELHKCKTTSPHVQTENHEYQIPKTLVIYDSYLLDSYVCFGKMIKTDHSRNFNSRKIKN